MQFLAIPARSFWIPLTSRRTSPMPWSPTTGPALRRQRIVAGDQSQSGQFLHGYRSAWLPAALLQSEQQPRLADALFASTAIGAVFAFQQRTCRGFRGGFAAAKDTATNPAVLDAFALAIIASNEPLAFPGISGHEPNLPEARRKSVEWGKAMDELLKVAPNAGSYLSESDFFERTWQQSFWGSNYPRLTAVKKQYDPMVSSSSTMASGVRNGVRMVSPDWRNTDSGCVWTQ